MVKLNLINPQASDIAYKTLIFPDGQPHIVLILRGYTLSLELRIRPICSPF
jgi:hypothetical protein